MSDDNKIALHTFTDLVAERAKVSSAEANIFIHQLAKTISEELEKGGDIHLYHFGRFHTTHIDEQAGHNPNSGAPLTIPEHTRVHFHPYSALRLAVNAPFSLLRIRELSPDKSAWRTRPGVWILLALLLLLLILLGIRDKSDMPTPDAPVALSELSSDKPAVMRADPIADTRTPATSTSVKAESTPTASATTTEFVVSPGDTLWGIATTRLGDPYWWPIIYAENRPELPHRNPDLIDSGITLRIPTLSGSANKPNIADLRLRKSAYQIVADDYRKLGNPRAAAYKTEAAHMPEE